MMIILTRAQYNAIHRLTSNLTTEIINVYAVLNSNDMSRFRKGFGRALEFTENNPHRKKELLARLHRPTSLQSVTRFVSTIQEEDRAAAKSSTSSSSSARAYRRIPSRARAYPTPKTCRLFRCCCHSMAVRQRLGASTAAGP